MPPLDRYLKDVRAHLPSEQADDIANELAENLRARFEDREAELGRPLTDAEQEALLKEHGNPLVVAARYRPEQPSLTFGRQLIGPALFPTYIRVLTINVVITVLVAVGAAIAVAGGQPLGSAFSSVGLAILIQFGIVTAIFVAADRAIVGEPGPSTAEVSAVEGGPRPSWLDRLSDQLIGKDHRLAIPRRVSVFDLAVSVISVGWLVWIRPPSVIEDLRSGPGWESFYLPVVIVLALTAIQPIVNFVRPEWTRLRSVARILSDAPSSGWRPCRSTRVGGSS